MSNHSDSSHYSSHVVAATLVSFWLTLYQTSAQSRETAFGQVRVASVPAKVDRFTLSHKTSEPVAFYCWSFHGATITSAWIDSNGTPGRWREHYLKTPVDDFMLPDFPFEHKQVGVGVDNVARSLSFYTNLSADTLTAVSILQLPLAPDGIAFGDLNGDRKTDFVAYDRDTPGAIPFFGFGNDKFKQGKALAPDNAIGGLKLVHLNNDSLLDIVLYDWVRSELHFLYGVGQGKFLDQASYPVEGEVRDFAVRPLTQNGNLDIVLSCRRPAKLEILQGNGLGDFTMSQRISLDVPFLAFAVDDVNGDGFRDIVGIDGSSTLHVYLNAGDNTFDEHLDFACGRDVTQFALYSAGRRGLSGVAMLDRGSQHVVTIANAQQAAQIRDSVDISTGSKPRGVSVADMNGDGFSDVAVVTGGSNSIAFYFNGRGGLYGQLSYALPANAHDVVFHSLVDSTARLLISYPNSRQMSLFSLDEKERTSTNATISTERAVELLYWNGLRKPVIDFYTFSPPAGNIPASMTLFQEIGSHQFIEQSFRLLPTSTLLGAGVGNINSDQRPDVAYVYRNNVTGKHELAVSLADSLFTYKQKTFSLELADKSIGRSHVWIIDPAWKGHPDIFLLSVGSTPLLERLRWLKESAFGRPDTLAKDLRIEDAAQLKFVDVDGDGIIDIVVNDQDKGEIGWMRARGQSFDPFRRLCSVPVRSHFALGDLNGDGIPDLALTLSDLGMLRIYDGKTLVRKSLEKSR
ncbi:MAG: VCBS repeat-containing protein [Ignavibacteriales bacterium]|nr:VCBS repeat-containing protein [Ignavibacteriales bacterium]